MDNIYGFPLSVASLWQQFVSIEVSMPSERTLTVKITPFGLRLQPGLKSKLEAAAAERERSLNSEIQIRLEDSFKASASAGPLSSFLEVFQDDHAATARVTSRLYDAKQSPYDIVVIDQDLAARIQPIADMSSRTVHDEVLATIEEKFPDGSAFGYGHIASSLRQVIEANAAENLEPLYYLLREIEKRVTVDHDFLGKKP